VSAANELTNRLLLEIPKRFPARVWRANVLAAMAHGRFVRAGQPGQGDISGIIMIAGVGVRLEIEIKTGSDKQKKKQKCFGEMIIKHGGIYLVARDFDQTMLDVECEVGALRDEIDGI
jgi:hypothetical protein